MLVQPIEFKSEDINQQFKKVHKIDLIEDSKNFIEEDDKEKFVLFLKKNRLSAPPLFITKVKTFKILNIYFILKIYNILQKKFVMATICVSVCFWKDMPHIGLKQIARLNTFRMRD